MILRYIFSNINIPNLLHKIKKFFNEEHYSVGNGNGTLRTEILDNICNMTGDRFMESENIEIL